MANKKRRITSRELRDLQKIERLLDNHKTVIESPTERLKIEVKPTVKPTINSSWIDNVKMTDHSFKRAQERYNMDSKNSLSYFRSQLKHAKRIGLQRAEDGSESVLYANGRNAIYVTPDLKFIKTVDRHQSVTYEPIKAKVAELHAKEIRKIERAEKARLKKLENEELKANVEIANARLRMHKSRSQSVKVACAAYIKGIEQYIGQLKNEIEELQASKRQICRSMVSVV